MAKRTIVGLLACAVLIVAVALAGGVVGSARGADAPDSVAPETCIICHKGAGEMHQAAYDQLYQGGVIKVTNMAYSYTAPNKSVVTFKITKNGAPFNINDADSWGIQYTPYTGKAFEAAARVSLKGTATCDAAGNCSSTVTANLPDASKTAGIIALYGADEIVGILPARVSMAKYPFAAVLETGSGVDYVSAANASGCEKCHNKPFGKHGYILGEVPGVAKSDFYVCKGCHLDNGAGGHVDWQILVDDPALAAAYLAGEAALTDAQKAQYAYKTTLMNDVHMSHAMEFAYPQSMANCVTCHEGKLDKALADANFKISTCKSCHPVNGTKGKSWDTTTLALNKILPPAIHGAMNLETTDCTMCHGAGKTAPAFKQIHTGYNKMIYTASGQRYSDAIKVSIDSATLSGTMLNIKFSASESPDIAGLDVASIAPTVLVGLYGWETKQFIVGPHETLIDDNGDGKIASPDSRALEAAVGTKHPRLTTVSSAGGKWEVTANLSAWSNLIANGTVLRAEIGVIPNLKNAAGLVLALNAPSRTFNLVTNTFNDGWYPAVVKVTDGCNKCHDALGTTFHSPDRGGNVVICRLCHTPTNGGSHLELQSRSIDSYVHAIHSFQVFDPGDIDFTDPVADMRYNHHVESIYPKHGTDCESCHNKGTYNVPDQTKSLPGLLSTTDTWKGFDREIGSVPSYITGPGARACGACHRAIMINEDKPGELIPFLQHTKMGGYLIEAGSSARAQLVEVMNQVHDLFD
ncbi:MAG: hypothetical protein Q7O66_00565 [Dehalococcoidia bacterium]|nr:hypothetical protein [Dehalococcoidia bacterium]